jgi:hypothetical protein
MGFRTWSTSKNALLLIMVAALSTTALACERSGADAPAEAEKAEGEGTEAEKTKGSEQAEGSESAPEVDLPEDRDLDPYDLDSSDPVTGENLHDEILAWENAWKNKEVSVIAYVRGGMSPGDVLKMGTKQSPGGVLYHVQISDEERTKMGKVAAEAEFAVIKGRVELPSFGKRLTIKDAVTVGPYEEKAPPSDQQIDPEELQADTPINPVDLQASIDAWKGVEVTIKDQFERPMSGNVMTVPKKGEGEDVWLKARLAGNLPEGSPGRVVETLQCEVVGMQQRGSEPAPYASVKGCELVE